MTARIINPLDIWTINLSEKDTTEIQEAIYQCEQCGDQGFYYDYDEHEYDSISCDNCEKGLSRELNILKNTIERATQRLAELQNEKREIKND
jgi:hypothetical protein